MDFSVPGCGLLKPLWRMPQWKSTQASVEGGKSPRFPDDRCIKPLLWQCRIELSLISENVGVAVEPQPEKRYQSGSGWHRMTYAVATEPVLKLKAGRHVLASF